MPRTNIGGGAAPRRPSRSARLDEVESTARPVPPAAPASGPTSTLTHRVSIWVDPDQWDALRARARAEGRAPARVIHDLVAEYLDH